MGTSLKIPIQQDTSSAESNSENYTSTSSSQQQVDTIFHPEELKAVTIFNQMALTKRNPHEVEEMRERKKQKNRESAQRARDRFKSKMRWLEDQVRLIQERHDNLVRENTYMRHMHSAQSQKLDQLIKLDQEATVQEAAEQQVSVKRPHSSSDQDSDQDSGIRSPKQSKFSIGFLSQSSKAEEKKESAVTYPGLSNPTAIYGFLPHQLPKLNFEPMLSQAGAVPALRLSPGGTMHMESSVSFEDDDEEEVDVGSPVRSDSDHGIGSSEHNSTTDQSSDNGHQSE